MELPVMNMDGAEVGNVELPASVFGAKVNNGLMHQALVRQMANARQGTHKAKGRSEINRTTAKAYKQKGTGRARHGSRRAPIFVGGGVAHGPLPRDYTKKMPKKMRRAALCSALTSKVQDGNLVVVDALSMEQPKTKAMIAVIDRLVGDSSALVLVADRNEHLEKSARNIADVKALLASYLNIRDLLGYDKLIMPLDALQSIVDMLGKGDDAVVAGEEE